MKFRVFSDIHIDANNSIGHKVDVPVMPGEEEQILLFAGDLMPFERSDFIPELMKLAERFHRVYYVPGNHEYYGGIFQWVPESVRQSIPDNVRLVTEPDYFTIVQDGRKVDLVCGTLWTNFFGRDPVQMQMSKQMMNDFRMIRHPVSGWELTPEEMARECDSQRSTLNRLLGRTENFTVVMTHHLPSRLSVSLKFANSPINGAFANDFDDMLEEADVWIHGHTHDTVDYPHPRGCKVICNPYGYNNENFNFNPYLTFEV